VPIDSGWAPGFPWKDRRGGYNRSALHAALRLAACLLLAVLLLAADGGSVETDDVDLDSLPSASPTLEDFGYFLSRLKESEKSNALNILADLSAESRLDPALVASVLRGLLDDANPPSDYGYGCGNCFLRRLSDLLGPLRLKGPRVSPPPKGAVVIRLNDGFLKRLSRQASDELDGSLPALVQRLLDGYELAGKFRGDSYVRYHARGGDLLTEPAFFTDADALATYEAGLDEPLDAWSLARWQCTHPPRNRFEPGFLVLYFDPTKACTQVRIPTAGDCENPDFRPTPASETEAGRTCGGAPEWVCPNIPLTEMTRVRYVPHTSYTEGIARPR